MQERLLARRVLHFGARQMAWECCEENLASNEEHPTGQHVVERDHNMDMNTKARFEAMDSSDAIGTWNMVIEKYSGMALSFADDKLVAISGIAKHVRAKIGHLSDPQPSYLAGLWQTEIMSQLLWLAYPEKYYHSSSRPQSYRAPS